MYEKKSESQEAPTQISSIISVLISRNNDNIICAVLWVILSDTCLSKLWKLKDKVLKTKVVITINFICVYPLSHYDKMTKVVLLEQSVFSVINDSVNIFALICTLYCILAYTCVLTKQLLKTTDFLAFLKFYINLHCS